MANMTLFHGDTVSLHSLAISGQNPRTVSNQSSIFLLNKLHRKRTQRIERIGGRQFLRVTEVENHPLFCSKDSRCFNYSITVVLKKLSPQKTMSDLELPQRLARTGGESSIQFFPKIRSDCITQASFRCANKLEPSPKHLDIFGFPKMYTRKIYMFSKTSDLTTASHSFSCATYMAYPKKTAKNHERPPSCLATPNIAWASCTSQATCNF